MRKLTQEICYKTLQELTDESLMLQYKKCNSVKIKTRKLDDILVKYIDKITKQKILQEYILELIPPGTKGVIRGNKFNSIVKNYILKMELDTNKFNICFEKKCKEHITTEIPDWYIMETSNNKIIIGMNQLDLWKGGQQLNRGYKYIIKNENNNGNSKLLCVVCNGIQLKKTTNKVFKLIQTGFENNTLCYLNNLENIITTYFN